MRSRLSALWLACGAFGGEIVLMLTLPLLGRVHGSTEVAIFGVAVVAANTGKLVGSLKLDAAVTNATPTGIGPLHLAASMVCCVTALAGFAAYEMLRALNWLPQAAQAAGPALCAIFACGGLHQVAAMRLLRQTRLATFALLKALPSLLAVLLAISFSSRTLVAAYALAFALTAAGIVVVSLPGWMRHPGLTKDVRTALATTRNFMLQGAPAAALDSGNMLALSMLTVALAGPYVAGQATQLQRIVLAPSLAASLLLSQRTWLRVNAPDDVQGWLADWERVMRRALAAAALSAALAGLTLLTPLAQRLVGASAVNALAVFAALSPLLAQFTGSPLTVYFFRREAMHLYAALQAMLLAALAAAAGVARMLPSSCGTGVLLVVAAAMLMSTVFLSARAVSLKKQTSCVESRG